MRKVLLLLLSVAPIFLLTLARGTVLPQRQALLVPFESLATLCAVGWGGHGVYIAGGLVANVLLFVPLGYVLGRCGCGRWAVAVPLVVSLAVEIAQYLTRLGTFEVDDLICNAIGGIAGYELGVQASGQRKGDFRVVYAYMVVLGLCCLRSILL